MYKKIAITGAQSYTGRYVAKMLVDRNYSIVNLTNHPNRPWKFNSQNITNKELKFDRSHLVESLRGCDALVQTYWVRFDNSLGITRKQVTENSKLLMDCAKDAGVKKIVYTSHTQTSIDSPFDYIREKAKVEKHLQELGVGWGIIRPCGIFGETPHQSIMLNNIAYLVRKFPVFPMPGTGNYYFQFVHVCDMAELIIKSIDSQINQDVDAVGVDKLTFKQIIKELAKALNTTCIPIGGISKNLIGLLTKPIDWIYNDKLIDKNDLDLMITGLTVSHKPPTGKRSLIAFINENKDTLGRQWTSSIQRYYKK